MCSTGSMRVGPPFDTRRPRTPRCWPARRPAAAADRGGRQRGAGHGRGRSPGRALERGQGGRGARSGFLGGSVPLDWPPSSRPDVVLLTGGTDGGDEEGILLGAERLSASGWRGPVVVAGNVAAHSAVASLLEGWPVVVTDNVVPRIGVLAPEPARRAIREMFLEHVIGGKGLSSRADFTAMVRGRDARPRAHRGRGARGGGGGRCGGGRHRGSDDRRALRRTPRSGGRRPLARGGGHDARDAHGRG